jgi:hypothetical protein
MKKLVAITIITALMSPVVNAKIISCIGMDATNKTIKVIADGKGNKIIINGSIFKATKLKNYDDKISGIEVLFTNNFINVNGTYVYNVLGFFTEGKFIGEWFLAQRNVTTEKTINFMSLSCSIEND